jgi:hypothetical protein
MLNDAQRRRFDIVMAWAIDRLGRSLIDLLGTIQTLEACAVDLYVDQQSIDTTTPAGRLMFQITGAFAEFERSMIRQRVRAGLKRAVESGKQLGRPRLTPRSRSAFSLNCGPRRACLPLRENSKWERALPKLTRGLAGGWGCLKCLSEPSKFFAQNSDARESGDVSREV